MMKLLRQTGVLVYIFLKILCASSSYKRLLYKMLECSAKVKDEIRAI